MYFGAGIIGACTRVIRLRMCTDVRFGKLFEECLPCEVKLM